MKLEEMIEELIMYYEAAGFKNYNENLEGKTEEEIKKLYNFTFNDSNEIF